MGRKSVALPIGACFRAACNHPLLMVMLCFLAFLYRSFPYVFSLLLSAFPIIFCTGVLLGALLSFSQQKAPEIKREEEMIHRAVHLQTEISNNVSVVERDKSYSVQRHIDRETSNGCSVVGSIEEVSSDDDTSREDDDRDGSFSDIDTRLAERSQEIQFGRAERELHSAGFGLLNKEHGDGLILKDHCLPIPKLSSENFEVEIDKSVGSCDSKLVNIDSPPCLGSPAKHEEEDDDDDEILDSGSDRAESSSPDASVADIVPMLDDELHPLLDEDAPQPVNLSQDGSDVTSEHFSRSNDSGTESDDSTEEKTELQVEDEDDEEIQGDKDDITKSAIKWTEEDQKNVMEVGSSELERNQLLERVMERRRSRKWVSMMGGKELVNLESPGPPIVTTTSQNPFDLLPDSYEEGLPPIPGSAPSILVPRRNPFDIPYYSSEEKSDLSGENSRLDFLDFQPKETFFQRSEFLNVGPSIFAQEKQDASCESYFVAEPVAPEGTSYSMVYTQSNGLSGSKVSSGPETESMGSDEDLEDKNVIKEDIEKKLDEGDMEEKKLIDERIFVEPVLISKIEHASEHVGHGSQSSEEEESLESGMGGLKNILVDEIVMKLEGPENHRAVEPSMLHDGMVPGLKEFHSELETLQRSYSNPSSSPTSSEVSERIFVEKEEKPSVEERRCSAADTGISRQPSLDGSELSISSTLVEEGQRREPVYDSSPPRLRRNLSSSSIALDTHESWFPPIQVKRTVSFAEGVIMMGSNRDTEMSIPIIKEMLGSSTISQPVSADESETREAVVPNEHEVSKSFVDTSKNSLNSQGDIKHLQDQLSSSISEANTQDRLNQTDESTSKSSADQEAQDKSP